MPRHYCIVDGCKEKNIYGYLGGKKLYCEEHKAIDMIPIKSLMCLSINCPVTPVFGIKGGKPQYCKTHKLDNMIDIRNTICIAEKCTIRASYNIPGMPARYCKDHKTIMMIDVINKRCEYTGCTKINPIYDFKDGKGKFCIIHKKEGMIDVKHIKCIADDCNKRPNYNYKGKQAKYCFDHKLDLMINVVSNTCKFLNCHKTPSYDYIGCNGLYCKDHKLDNMIYVKAVYCKFPGCTSKNTKYRKLNETGGFCIKHKTDDMIKSSVCAFKGCNLSPSFNLPGKIRKYCSIHKTSEMINIYAGKCIIKDCNKHASFNYINNTAKFCFSHKESNMINVNNHHCKYKDCLIRASFGFPGKPKARCLTHREKGMIRNPNSKCKICRSPALWGVNNTPIHCNEHKIEGEINLVESICKGCGLLFSLSSNEMCEYCDPDSFKYNYLIKQSALFKYLDSVGLYGIQTDKIIDNGSCGKERPDRVFDFDDKIIIVECDEFQHKNITPECEQVRMLNIGQSFGGVPVYFIRWNPDDFTPLFYNKIENIKERYKVLENLIKSIQNNILILPIGLVSCIYLYYDSWAGIDTAKWNIIQKYDTTC